jgi:outer membrane cobalamin receptor
MKKYIILLLIIFPAFGPLKAQDRILQGTVKGSAGTGDKLSVEPLIAANVYWLGTTTGTITDTQGHFALQLPESGASMLVVSYTGFKNDTLKIVSGNQYLDVTLYQDNKLDEVILVQRQSGSFISSVQPIKTEVITTAGLRKLACCNLAESFENSATVDVNYTDAISGARIIQLLGLSGIYSQLMTENIPSVRGLAIPFGLNQIPGPWMESIQIAKGTSSVINGYESITGQINVEMQKPEKAPSLFLNLYGSSEGRLESNLNLAHKLNEKWSAALLAHGSMMTMPEDFNKDGFIDMPMGNQINLLQRWNYQAKNGRSQFGYGIMDENTQGGQLEYFTSDHPSDYYSTSIHSRKYQAFAKNGIMFERPATSLGMVSYFSRYEQSARFAARYFEGSQNSFYNNLIFQSYLGNTNHAYSTGISFMADSYEEKLDADQRARQEIVPGTFFQYNYNNAGKINLIAGIRADYNSAYGWFISPRVHFKYNPDSLFSIRLSGGKGYRTVNIYSDNLSQLASSRTWIIQGKPAVEEAWNYGIDLTKSFLLSGSRKSSISLDYYRTDFISQWVVDIDKSARELNMYNLDGKSFSNSFQAEIRIEPVSRLEISAAWRVNDVKVTYSGKLQEKPMVSRNKSLLSVSYALPYNKWQFDLTGQFNGTARLPDLSENPVNYQRADRSDAFYMLHAQITRRYRQLEVYAGGENLLNYKQKNPIISSEDPAGEYFDATLIWGPISGIKAYAGIRFTLR